MLFHFCATLFHFSLFCVCVGTLRIGFSEVSLRKMFAFFSFFYVLVCLVGLQALLKYHCERCLLFFPSFMCWYAW